MQDLCLTGHNLALAVQLANARILEDEMGQVNKAELDGQRDIAQEAQDMFLAHRSSCAECRGHPKIHIVD